MSVPKVFYSIFSDSSVKLILNPCAFPVSLGAPVVKPLTLVRPRRPLFLRGNNLLRRGTKIAIRTERAVILGIRSKLPARDCVRHLLHAQLGFFQLRVGPRRADSRVVFEVIQDEAGGRV